MASNFFSNLLNQSKPTTQNPIRDFVQQRPVINYNPTKQNNTPAPQNSSQNSSPAPKNSSPVNNYRPLLSRSANKTTTQPSKTTSTQPKQNSLLQPKNTPASSPAPAPAPAPYVAQPENFQVQNPVINNAYGQVDKLSQQSSVNPYENDVKLFKEEYDKKSIEIENFDKQTQAGLSELTTDTSTYSPHAAGRAEVFLNRRAGEKQALVNRLGQIQEKYNTAYNKAAQARGENISGQAQAVQGRNQIVGSQQPKTLQTNQVQTLYDPNTGKPIGGNLGNRVDLGVRAAGADKLGGNILETDNQRTKINSIIDNFTKLAARSSANPTSVTWINDLIGKVGTKALADTDKITLTNYARELGSQFASYFANGGYASQQDKDAAEKLLDTNLPLDAQVDIISRLSKSVEDIQASQSQNYQNRINSLNNQNGGSYNTQQGAGPVSNTGKFNNNW